MSRQFWAETIYWATSSGTAVANTTTETILFPDVTIPGNFLADGRSMRLTAAGKYSTTGTPTLLFSLRFGGVAGTLLCKSAAMTCASGVTAAMWWLDIVLTVQSNGASGTVMVNGMATVGSGTAPTVGSATGAPAISPMTAGGIITPAAVAVNMTADAGLSLTGTWSAASASNTTTGLNYLLEALTDMSSPLDISTTAVDIRALTLEMLRVGLHHQAQPETMVAAIEEVLALIWAQQAATSHTPIGLRILELAEHIQRRYREILFCRVPA